MATKKQPYKAKFVQADNDGDYVSMGKRYSLSLTEKDLIISKHRIPLLKILRAERVGKGVAITYLDSNKIPTKIMLTTDNLFGLSIGRAKKLDELVRVLESAVDSQIKRTPAQELAKAQQVAPPDTCHECGNRGGAHLRFGQIYSGVLIARWSSNEGIYCKKHSTIHGLRSMAISGVLGWWSPWGIFITPVYIFRNLRSLWLHSNVPKLLVCVLGAIAFVPVLFLIKLIMAKEMS